MAEAAVSFVLERLADVVMEIQLAKDVRRQVERLLDELKRMLCFLRDADSKQQGDTRVSNWVSDIRNVAYDAEDLIDTYLLNVESSKKRPFFKRYASILKKWTQCSDIGKELEAIQLRISDISASRQTYGIKNIGEATSHANEKLLNLRRSSPRGQERDIIGLEEDIATLVAQLVKDGNQLRAISIVGMGGIGKTTLAKEVYNHVDVIAHFDCRAWVYVSQDFTARNILQGIIKQVMKTTRDLTSLQEDELEEMLYEHLQSRPYLLVLDDIWSNIAWDSLAKAFPNGDNGSRLLLTTRNNNVALHADARSTVHQMRFRSKEDSWKLFCRKTFNESIDRVCPPQLVEIGGEIVERCAGLPLAIIVLGGLLSRKRRLSEWQRILNTIQSQLSRDPNGVSAIIALSYYDLPYYLKFCFLHLGLFPEDYSISTRKLYRLWIAEGFIRQHGERMEEIAEDYLNELIDRNMVQVARMSANDRVKHCRLHDLLRDLSISKSRSEQFFATKENHDLSTLAKARHHAIYSGSIESLDDATQRLRSLLFFRAGRQRIRNFGMSITDGAFVLFCVRAICNKFKLIRVLDLEGMKLRCLPSTVGKLIHLKYLGLRDNSLESLPIQIGDLTNLQTLDIAGNCNLESLPNVFWKMMNLRHLYMYAHTFMKFLRIDTLRHLQTLSDLHIQDWKHASPVNLMSLRKLGLRGNFGTNTDELFISLSSLVSLQSLFLHSEGNFVLPSLRQLGRVIKLQITGGIRKLPSWNEFPPKLTQLIFHKSRLSDDPMEMLKKLPYLFVLRLKASSYEGNQLKVSAGGFPQLEILELECLELLKDLLVEETALPQLRSFQISYCSGLRMIPEGLKFIPTLHELEIKNMPKGFTDRLQGEDYCKVQHVPSIKIH